MNKRLLLSTLAAWMLLGVSVHAEDDEPDFLYLFIGSSSPYQYTMDEEQTVIFKEEKIEVRLGEAVWEVEYEEFEKITLSVAPVPTAMKPVKDTLSGIDIRYDAARQQLIVESGETLRGIDIFSLQGMKQQSEVVSGDKHSEVSLADLPSGIYVVRASDGTNSKTLKIVKR